MYATRRQDSPQNPKKAICGIPFGDNIRFAKTAGYMSSARPTAKTTIAEHAKRVNWSPRRSTSADSIRAKYFIRELTVYTIMLKGLIAGTGKYFLLCPKRY
jgi:hypothetical protein